MTQGRYDPDRRFLPSIDTELDCVSKNIRELHEYWRTKLDGRQMPTRGDIDPIEIPNLLPYIALIDVEWTPRRFRWRLIGTHITTALGYDSTGFHFDDKYAGQALADLMAVYERVIERKAPIRHYGKPTFADQVYSEYESAHFPLSEDGERVEIIMVGLEFLRL